MDNTLLFLKDNAVAVGIVLTIVGLIGGAIGASVRFLIDSKKIENEKKALRQQMITNNIAPMRQEWIDEVRLKSSELISSLQFIITYKTMHNSNLPEYQSMRDRATLEMFEIHSKSIYFELLLPISENKDDKEIVDKIKENIRNLMNFTYKPNDGIVKNDVFKEINACVKNIQILLKKEWEVTKSLNEIK